MLTPDKEESLYHTLLVLEGTSIASKKADDRIRTLLEQHGTLKNAHNQQLSLFEPDIGWLAEKLEKAPDFRTITVNNPEYPDWLKELNATPVIYARGNLELLKTQTIAVIGTRHPTQEALEEGREKCRKLLNENYTIVSGLASGCDTLGHKQAIEHDSRTIAVIGTPLDKHYPPENRQLQEQIAKEHLLITPFPIGITTRQSHFAYRNHLTVSLSKEGIVVIQADDKSGTQHAIRHASRQGKTIYALPNNFDKGYKWVEKYRPAKT